MMNTELFDTRKGGTSKRVLRGNSVSGDLWKRYCDISHSSPFLKRRTVKNFKSFKRLFFLLLLFFAEMATRKIVVRNKFFHLSFSPLYSDLHCERIIRQMSSATGCFATFSRIRIITPKALWIALTSSKKNDQMNLREPKSLFGHYDDMTLLFPIKLF